jgi:Predicted metal-binding, possibly nucleic acid-binding protein
MKVIIPLREIGYDPKVFEIKIPPEEIEYSGEYEIVGEFEISINVQKTDVGHKIRVDGKVPMKFVCSRCLDEFYRDFYFADENILRKGQEEVERLGDLDVETWVIERDDVDVIPIIRDIFIVSLPINPVCSADCLGICPVCGERMVGKPHKHEVKGVKLGDIIASAKRR